MSKYFNYYFFLPFAVSFVGGIGYSAWINQDYKSEWLDTESIIVFTVFFTVSMGIMMAAFSTFILLNKLECVRSKFILSFFSWFLFPISVFVITMRQSINSYNKEVELALGKYEPSFFSEEMNSMLILFLPYVIGAIISFILFRKDLNRTG